jgi:hypothetical protein
MVLKVCLIDWHLFHLRDGAFVDRNFSLHKIQQLRVELRRPHRLRQTPEEEFLRTTVGGAVGTSGPLREGFAGGNRMPALAH